MNREATGHFYWAERRTLLRGVDIGKGGLFFLDAMMTILAGLLAVVVIVAGLVGLVFLANFLFPNEFDKRERERKRLIRILKTTRNIEKAKRTAYKLGFLHENDSEAARALIEALNKREAVLGRAAAESLCHFRGCTEATRTRVIDQLVAAWAGSDYPSKSDVDRAIERTLWTFGMQALDRVLDLLGSEQDVRTRALVAKFFGELAGDPEIRPLRTLLELQDPQLRRRAILALKRIDDADFPAIAAAAADALPVLRASAATVMGRLNDARCAPLLNQLADDLEPQVKQTALASLTTREARIQDFLERIRVYSSLRPRDQGVLEHAINALGALKERRAVSVLIPLLKDDVFRSSAITALESIGGEDLDGLLASARRDQEQYEYDQRTGKTCSNCGRKVSHRLQAGDRYPHCGVYWSHEVTARP